MCKTFPSLDTLFETMCLLLGKRLQNMGLIPPQQSSSHLMKVILNIKKNKLNCNIFFNKFIIENWEVMIIVNHKS